MPLGTNLAADIEAVFNQPPASAHAAAVGLAQAYYDYTSGALFGASIPVITTALRDAMAATLEAGLGVPGAPPTAAAAYAAAVATYWTGVPVAGASGAGVVPGCPGAASLTGTLTGVFANLANTQATCAAGIAAALQTATLTCVAPLTLPPAGPIPTPIG